MPASKRARLNEKALQTSSSSVTVASQMVQPWQVEEDEEEEPRTSRLQAPIMMLTGHEAPIYCFKFSPDGEHAASAGHERVIFLWEVYGDCVNYNVLRGHKNAIIDLSWLDRRTLCTASADKTVMLWDAHVGKRTKKLTGHTGFVNAVSPARNEPALASGSDDGRALLWDLRAKSPVGSLEVGRAVTAVAFAEDHVFTGSIDDIIRCFDLRTATVQYELREHTNTITSLALSPDGVMLLSNAMDAKLHCWDVRPLAAQNRLTKTFSGHQHDFHKNLLRAAWSPDGQRVSAGSSDQVVRIWDYASVEELYYLPGHRGSVNDVHFHPSEPIFGSCSSDSTIYLGEIAA